MSDIDKAIINLYDTFRNYPLKPKIEGCPHCELDSAESTLHIRQLHYLTWDDFGVYPFKAMTTFGDLKDFKHFLPRMLELYRADYKGSPYGVFILFEKLNYGAWESWSISEVEAVRIYLNLWLEELRTKRAIGDADVWQVEEIISEFRKYGFASSVTD